MSEPAWLSEKYGIYGLVDQDTFYRIIHVLLHAAYQEGRLSVLEEAFKSANRSARESTGSGAG